jgi:hypothetical protein
VKAVARDHGARAARSGIVPERGWRDERLWRRVEREVRAELAPGLAGAGALRRLWLELAIRWVTSVRVRRVLRSRARPRDGG